jgi:hypothetical protein
MPPNKRDIQEQNDLDAIEREHRLTPRPDDSAAPPKQFNWRCALGLHPWGKWSPVIRSGGLAAPFPYQERDCPRCGLHARKVRRDL